ncbi:Ig-like domain repeat protein, partial [Chloroflexota bacterium]
LTKWAQLPDDSDGIAWISMRISEDQLIAGADNFLCTETGLITDIHVWGSWAYDELPEEPAEFYVGIYANIPANESATGFSVPGEQLWSSFFGPDDYIVTSNEDYQGILESGWGAISTSVLFQYNFHIPKENYFIQEQGTIYWLSVMAIYQEVEGYLWGWNFARYDNRWTDNAFWYGQANGETIEYGHAVYPVGHEHEGESMDTAFAITTSYDYGDAPNDENSQSYPTLLINDGARHGGNGPYLGTNIDYELDGQPNPDASGDDITDIDDEDGILFTPCLVPGKTANIEVTVNTPTDDTAFLNAWIDFNIDGDWADSGEQIFTDEELSTGTHTLSFSVPAGAKPGSTFARFRFSSDAGLSFTGMASDGEVEDYQVNISGVKVNVANSKSQSVYCEPVRLTATVEVIHGCGYEPTGDVEFFDGATSLGTAPLSSQTAQITASNLSAGTHLITARYLGSDNFNPSTSSPITQVVTKANTTTRLYSMFKPAVYGQRVSFKAVVTATQPSSCTPTGTITFKDLTKGTILGTVKIDASGQALLTTWSLLVGSHSIIATYNPDANHTGNASTPIMQVIEKSPTTTALTSSTNLSTYGQVVYFTATVQPSAGGSGTPTGIVTFKDMTTGKTLGTATLRWGTAKFGTSLRYRGSHSIVVVYGGDSNFKGSTSYSLTQRVR